MHGEHADRARAARGARFQEPRALAARRGHASCSGLATRASCDLPRPIAAYVGRVAVEKNVDAFLRMPWKGTKLVIGDGPELPRLKAQYPDAVYAGFRFGEDLARHLAAADVLVFPSLTDTFGLVNLEAMACGVPVAAFPVTGPIDVVEDGVTGALDEDLARAAAARAEDRSHARAASGPALRLGHVHARVREQSRRVPGSSSPRRAQRCRIPRRP